MTKIFACGFIVLDILATDLSYLPKPGEAVIASNGIKFWIGGHPANMSVDLMQMGLEEGDVRVALAVGKDLQGDFCSNFLRARGVKGQLQRVENAQTGISLVLVKKGEDKAVTITLGANLSLDYNYVISSLKDTKPKILYVASGILGDFDFRLAELLEFCQKNHIHTIVDLANPYQKEWNYSHPALPYINVLHSNVKELRGITGKIESIDGLRWLSNKGVKLPIVSDGKFGAIAFFKGKFIKQPAFNVNAVDPTGAGDAMCAGTAKKLLEAIECGKALEDLNIQEVTELLLFAQAAGAACVGEIGTTAGVRIERINQILKEQGEKVLSQTVVTQ